MKQLFLAVLLYSFSIFSAQATLSPKAFDATYVACWIDATNFVLELQIQKPKVSKETITLSSSAYLHGCYVERMKANCFYGNSHMNDDGLLSADIDVFKNCLITSEIILNEYIKQKRIPTQKDINELNNPSIQSDPPPVAKPIT